MYIKEIQTLKLQKLYLLISCIFCIDFFDISSKFPFKEGLLYNIEGVIKADYSRLENIWKDFCFFPKA